MSLHPTKTRLALVTQINRGGVYLYPSGETFDHDGRRLTERVRELARAGWADSVDVPDRPMRVWRLTDTGRRYLLEPTTRYTVTFDPIGSFLHVPLLTVEVSSADDLSGRILDHAQPHLHSRDVRIWLRLDTMRGGISCSGQPGGDFTIAEVPA